MVAILAAGNSRRVVDPLNIDALVDVFRVGNSRRADDPLYVDFCLMALMLDYGVLVMVVRDAWLIS